MSKKTFSPEPNRPITPAEAEQLERLAAMADEDIDTIDIPEISEEAWNDERRPGLYRPVKRPVTIRLDADVIEWFKSQAGGEPYQTRINRVLRRHVALASRRA